MSVTRWDVSANVSMDESDSGEFVHYSDYEDDISSLQADYDNLKQDYQAAVEELNDERDRYAHVVDQIQDLYLGVK